ncbi:protein phosphatase 2C domain-containing protein [Faecalibacterium prausnitzii]|uniref:protein phosphatase 2C domain-containing protein n=1 Tax=Faecalibacterium prausnitzii TaxID=853 RepID=UPI0012DF63B0|nr:protein phosphatase 2C domain-containing protein [Faecalibacterium prausnitzii]
MRMNNILAFHKSVQGSNHIAWGRPCEDASGSYANPEKHYYVAAVSDGHGADECYRADKGSKIAVEIAIKNLQELAEKMTRTPEQEARFYQDILGSARYQQMTMRHLTDVIHAEGVDRVREDLQTNAPTEEELAPLQEKKKKNYAQSDRPEQVYGCTLMAALWMQKCLLLIHQGDGRCDVFYTDGTVNQPIPWDSRCVGTKTTSMCDDDAEPSFRSCVIDFQKKPVMACYLGCDGVEDAYRDSEEDMAGVHTFYKRLTYEVAHRTPEQLDVYLEEMLPRFSYAGLYNMSGSGDDVSVAAIVDTDAIRPFTAGFLRDTQVYTAKEDVFWKEDAVRSKIRKHGILQRRLGEAETTVQDSAKELEKLRNQRVDMSDDIARMRVFIANDAKELEQINSEKQSAGEDAERLDEETVKNPRLLDIIRAAAESFVKDQQKSYQSKKEELQYREHRLEEMERKLEALDIAIQNANQQQSALEEKLSQQRQEFAEYDAKFRSAQDAAARAKRTLDALLSAPPEEDNFVEIENPQQPVQPVGEPDAQPEIPAEEAPAEKAELSEEAAPSEQAEPQPEMQKQDEEFEIYFASLDPKDPE